MKLLFTGQSNLGSWHCRGDQIGTAMGATVKATAGFLDFRKADLSVVVKRVSAGRLWALRAARKPWVLDIVDFYPQPESAEWSRSEAIRWAQARLKHLRPSGVIWANQKMAEDVGFDGPQAVIYHHHRCGLRENPIRKQVRMVGYEGEPAYIEPWRALIESECRKRGWQFVINPAQLSDVDIVLALRGGHWDGYVQRNWKSNVKLANAHGSGTPFVGSPEEGYRETASGAEHWASDADSLCRSLDMLTEQTSRQQVAERFKQRAYRLGEAAAAYSVFLCGSGYF